MKALIGEMGAEKWEYITLDDQAQFEIAQADPVGFIRDLPPKRIALDEVQRLPELFVSIKQAVDEQRTAWTLSSDGFRQCFAIAPAIGFPG